MEKIKIINEILKNNFSIDIFNYQISDKNELADKINKKIDNYFTYKLFLSDVIKKIYGDDSEIVIKEKVITQIPSCVEKINFDNPNINRILNLSDLGYQIMEINYYIKQKNNDELIYIGTYYENVNKYLESLTENGFMNKLEQILNITLNPNLEHTEIIYSKRQILPEDYETCSSIPGFFVPADFDNYEEVIEDVKINKAIKTKQGKIIAKGLDCENFDGYSTDNFKPEKVDLNFNFISNNLDSSLLNIPNNVFQELLKVAQKHFYNNELIIKDIVECIKEHINDNINLLKDILFKSLNSIYTEYPKIKEYSFNINENVPFINYDNLKSFGEKILGDKKKISNNYDIEINSIKSDIEKIEQQKEKMELELKEMKEKLKLYWDSFCSKETNIFVIEDNIDTEITLYSRLENLYCEFEELILSGNIQKIKQIEEAIMSAKKELNYGRKFENFYTFDFYGVDKTALPFDAASEFINFIEVNLNNNNNLIQELLNSEKTIKELKNKLELMKENHYKEESKYEDITYHLNNLINHLYNLLYNKEKLLNIINSLEKIDSICYTGIKNSVEYKKLQLYSNLFNLIISGSIFSSDLEEKDKYFEVLNTQKPKYQDENYVVLIKKQLIKK